MSRDSEELRQDIAQTRQELSSDVDAIVDRVSPSQIAHRQGERIKGKFQRAKEAVMGSSESMGTQTRHTMDNVKDEVQHAPQRVREETRGNPLAAGLIAFGAGLLASSLLPSSTREGELVDKLKERAEPVTRELKDAAREVAQDMKEPVKQAAEELKQSARESAEHVKDDARQEKDHLQAEARHAKQDDMP